MNIPDSLNYKCRSNKHSFIGWLFHEKWMMKFCSEYSFLRMKYGHNLSWKQLQVMHYEFIAYYLHPSNRVAKELFCIISMIMKYALLHKYIINMLRDADVCKPHILDTLMKRYKISKNMIIISLDSAFHDSHTNNLNETVNIRIYSQWSYTNNVGWLSVEVQIWHRWKKLRQCDKNYEIQRSWEKKGRHALYLLFNMFSYWRRWLPNV